MTAAQSSRRVLEGRLVYWDGGRHRGQGNIEGRVGQREGAGQEEDL